MFDDQQTLADLSTVTNLDSAIQFIFSGHAGPLGRPLALASFSLQAYAWPDHPEILLRTNVLLHILNGAFLAWSLLLLGRLRGISAPQAEWGAIASSALWLVIPLLASSSLFIVQRMATLSATFMLLGLLGYLATRCRLDSQPKRALAGMSLSLVTFTVLATLSKESGALLPILILVIESALLRARLFKISVITRTWGLLFLILPLVAILIFIATQATYSEHMLLRREFTAGQRLWTQAEILWQYLLHAFIPMQSQLTPFHDHLKPSPSPLHPTTLIAIAAWGAAIGAAIRFRKRLPLLAFALAWYLGEHLLESTVLNLELYFAHRNYLALIGPVYALVASILTIPAPQAKLAHTLLAAYILVMAASLYSITTLWGRPAFAAEIWAIYNPDSIRANQNLAAALHQERWHSAALNVLNKTYSIDPGRRAATGIQALTLACAMQPDSDHSELATALISQVKTAQFDNDLPQNLLELQRLLLKEPCTGVDLETIEALTQNTLTNPVYASSARTKNNLHAVLTELAIAQKDFGKTMTHIEDSLRIMPTLDTLRLAIKVLTAAGRTDLGQGFIDMTRKGMPKHPIKRLDWQRQLDQLERQLAEVNATQQALQAQEAQ
ncbi:MAG: hypothetical protein Q8R69_04300 [Telluria sp.]|nr:hypothetical protein [Telluria sp.]